MKKNKTHISVVIPLYCCESCITELYLRLTDTLTKITNNYEIIMINDSSPSNDWGVIKELVKKDQRVKGISLSRNFGQHNAITAGLDYAEGDWVVVMDGDLQDQPKEIIKLYNKAQEGYDVVLAKREKKNEVLFKQFASWAFYKVFNYFTGMNYNYQIGNYRIISRKVVEHFRIMRENLRFIGVLIDWMGFTTSSVMVEHAERFAGESSYNFRKLLNLAISTIIAFSDKPLKLSIKIGFIMSFLSFLYGTYIIYRAIIYGTVVLGWNSLIVSLYFIGGIIIMNLGFIGIYLGKTFDETKKRPLYVIQEFLNF